MSSPSLAARRAAVSAVLLVTACTGPDAAAPASDPVPGSTAGTPAPATTAGTPATAAGPTAAEQAAATFEAIIASEPDYPRLSRVWVRDGMVQVNLHPAEASTETVSASARIGGAPTRDPDIGHILPPEELVRPAITATDFPFARLAAPILDATDCTEPVGFQGQVLHSGVLSALGHCGYAAEPFHIVVGDFGWDPIEGWVNPEAFAIADSIVPAAGISEVTNVLLSETNFAVEPAAPSVELSDGSTCRYTFFGDIGDTGCTEYIMGTEPFAYAPFAENFTPIMVDAVPRMEAAGGFFGVPGFNINHDDRRGEPLLSMRLADMTMLYYRADGTFVE